MYADKKLGLSIILNTKETMNTLTKIILIAILFSYLTGQSQTNSITDKTIQQLKKADEIALAEIIQLNVIDNAYLQEAESVNCDTSIQLNNDIFYSIIKISDKWGIFSHLFILTINEKNKKAIASQYIESLYETLEAVNTQEMDSYKYFSYNIVAKDTILLMVTTVYNERAKTTNNEEKKVERKEIANTYFIIEQTGQIIKNGKEVERIKAKTNPKDEGEMESSLLKSESFQLCSNSGVLLYSETYPEYNGGLKQLEKVLNSILKLDANINGKIYLKMRINCNGNVSEIQIERAIHPEILNITIMKKLMALQNWKAGTNNKQSVNCETRLTLPIVNGFVKFNSGQ